ncbi:MAG TPA: MarR family transcriptional regulator [Cyclobacteriaceae bacterium]|jgi:DNA-binding MarR family transcriptional regulator
MKIEDEIKQKAFHSIHQKAVVNLIYTSNWLLGAQQKFLSLFGITTQQFNILRILRGQHPNGVSATTIKARMLDKNSDVSRLLNRLVKKELIIKKSCPSDKRATDIFITERGLKVLDEINKERHKIDNVLCLTDAEAELLSDLLDKARGTTPSPIPLSQNP